MNTDSFWAGFWGACAIVALVGVVGSNDFSARIVFGIAALGLAVASIGFAHDAMKGGSNA